MLKVGVVLSGCGHQDGAEIHESVIAMLALEEAGAELVCLSLDKPQTKVVNHIERKPVHETRNVMIEAGRIARGNVRSIKSIRPSDLDAVVIPGGSGAALNLSDFADKGSKMSVDRDLENLLRGMHEAKKPIGAICIAPVILARVFGTIGARLTIGSDPETAAKVQQMGAVHINCGFDGCVVDEENLLVSTPAYMLAKTIKELHAGIGKLAQEVVRLARR